MTTLQEQFEKDYPNKTVGKIFANKKYKNSNFTNWDLDLSEYVNLERLELSGNDLTFVDFLKTIPNPEKLEFLSVSYNKIQPTDISIFSKFVNLERFKIGVGNKFYGSLKS
jgi:Leucine-rich repeat (LRR) protein